MNICFLFLNKVSYLIVDEADEDLEMAEDPFPEKELPAVLEEENVEILNKNELSKSKISIAVSNASEIAASISRYVSAVECSDKTEDLAGRKDPDKSLCNEDVHSHKISLLVEEDDKDEQPKNIF